MKFTVSIYRWRNKNTDSSAIFYDLNISILVLKGNNPLFMLFKKTELIDRDEYANNSNVENAVITFIMKL